MHLFSSSLFLFLYASTALATAAVSPQHNLYERAAELPHNDPPVAQKAATPHSSPQSTTPLSARSPPPSTPRLLPRAPWPQGFCISESNAPYNCQVGEDVEAHIVPKGTCWDWRCALPLQNKCACPPDSGRPNWAPLQFRPSSSFSHSTSTERVRPNPRARPRLPRPRLPNITPPVFPRLHPRAAAPHPDPPLLAPHVHPNSNLLARHPHAHPLPPSRPPIRTPNPHNAPLPLVVLPGQCDAAGPNCIVPPSRFTLMLTCQDWRCTVPGRRKCGCSLGAEGTRIHPGTEVGAPLKSLRMRVKGEGAEGEGRGVGWKGKEGRFPYGPVRGVVRM
ncbi:hypothetical protein MMC30_005781 [Trapelia coarctata]|nr:hypothetical protein [Trapelia coarctata]